MSHSDPPMDGDDEQQRGSEGGNTDDIGPPRKKEVVFIKHKDSRGRTIVKDSQGRTIFESRWDEMFSRLVAFKREKGHCLVPNRYKKDPQLGSWVSVQRQQYKILTSGGSASTPLTMDRAQRLIDIGFKWETKDPRLVPWENRFNALVDFVATYGHAQVPYGWKGNVQLATWVCTQRQEYKLYQTKRPSRLTSEKIHLLDDIGFTWKVDKGCRKKLLPIAEKDREEIVSIPKDAVITPSPEEVAANNAAEASKQSSTRYKRNPRVLPQGDVIRLPRRVAETIKSRGGIRSEPVHFFTDNRKPEAVGSSAISDTSSLNGSEEEHPTIARLRGASANGNQPAALPGYANLAAQISGNDFPILIATQNGLLPIGMTSQVPGFNSNSNGATAASFSGSQQPSSAYNPIAAMAARSNQAAQSPSTALHGYASPTSIHRAGLANHNSNRKRKDPPTAEEESMAQNNQVQYLTNLQQQSARDPTGSVIEEHLRGHQQQQQQQQQLTFQQSMQAVAASMLPPSAFPNTHIPGNPQVDPSQFADPDDEQYQRRE